MIVPHVKTVTEADFAASGHLRRLFVHDNARRFGALELPKSTIEVIFSWRSDRIEPTVVVDDEAAVVWIGVDERVAAIRNDGQVCFLLPLPSPLLTIVAFARGVIVVCELTALVVNHDGTIAKSLEFCEIPEDVEVHDNQLVVGFIDGTTQEFSL
jgi:hypothetical protein